MYLGRAWVLAIFSGAVDLSQADSGAKYSAVLETWLRRRERLTRLEELLEEFGIAHVRTPAAMRSPAASEEGLRSRAHSPRATIYSA